MRGIDFDILGGPVPLILALVALLLVACGPSAFATHVHLAQAMHDAQVEAEVVVREGRRSAMLTEARRVRDGGGSESMALDAANGVARRWQCAVDGHRLYGIAVATYVGEIMLAREGGSSFMDRLIPYAMRVLDSWRLFASCIGELSPGRVDDVPSFLGMFPASWSGPANGGGSR